MFLLGDLASIHERLRAHIDRDRQFVAILSALSEAGLEAVDAACTGALAARLHQGDILETGNANWGLNRLSIEFFW